MACSICGEEGHNKLKCPNKTVTENRNKALDLKVDNLTEKEQRILHAKFVEVKKKYAPEGRATLVEGDENEIGANVIKALLNGTNEE